MKFHSGSGFPVSFGPSHPVQEQSDQVSPYNCSTSLLEFECTSDWNKRSAIVSTKPSKHAYGYTISDIYCTHPAFCIHQAWDVRCRVSCVVNVLSTLWTVDASVFTRAILPSYFIPNNATRLESNNHCIVMIPRVLLAKRYQGRLVDAHAYPTLSSTRTTHATEG